MSTVAFICSRIYSHVHPHRYIVHPSFESTEKWSEQKTSNYIWVSWESFDKGFWIVYFQHLSESDVTWKAPFTKVRLAIVGTQEFNHLPLIGARGHHGSNVSLAPICSATVCPVDVWAVEV